MPMYQTKSGDWIDVDEGASPDVLRRLGVESAPVTKQQPRQPQTKAEKQTGASAGRFKRISDMTNAAAGWMMGTREGRTLTQNPLLAGPALAFGLLGTQGGRGLGSATFGMSDKAAAFADAKLNGGDFQTSKAGLREERTRQFNDNPGMALTSDITGAMANPLGTGATALQTTGKVLNSARLSRAGNAIANTGPLRQAALAGFNQGALEAGVRSDSWADTIPDALKGGAIGSVFGLGLGSAVQAGQRGYQIIRDNAAGSAGRIAYGRIAQLLENAGMSPERAVGEIKSGAQMGNDVRVMDLTPGLRAEAAVVSRRPNVPSSNAMIELGEQRIQQRPARMAEAARRFSGVQENASTRIDDVVGTRKAKGKEDYATGGVMDEPLNWTDDLDELFRNAPPQTNQALRNAYDEMLLRREQPAVTKPLQVLMNGGLRSDPNGIGTFDAVPNLRTLDYLKRGFDTEIGKALEAGDNATAQGLSQELGLIKGLVADQNPKYAEILATQRDLFQQQKALEIGKSAIQRLQSEPIALMKELQALPPALQMEARIGIIDAFAQLDRKANPLSIVANISRSADQRAVMEMVFGGRKNLRQFNNWIKRETRAGRADVLTAPGRQSETSRVLMADGEGGGFGDVLMAGARGQAFGGVVGAASGVIRTLQQLSAGMARNPAAQEEIAKILMSSGDSLVPKIKQVEAYRAARKASNNTRARMAGQAGATVGADLVN